MRGGEAGAVPAAYVALVRDTARSVGVLGALGQVAACLGGSDGLLQPPAELARPELLGELYQALMGRDERRARGAFYTPPDLAAEVAAETLGPLVDGGRPAGEVRVCDPAVGGGALLLAAARYLIGRGADPGTTIANLAGLDLDPVAARLARLALALLGGTAAIAVGDALATRPRGGFDAVVTNPPFLGQLKRDTARRREEAATRVARFGEAAGGYADAAALFLVVSLELVGDGGRVGIILPEPALVTRDAGPARRRVGGASVLARQWPAPPSSFDAGTRAR
ncbi:MAG TPA: N-6 DNA methylase, partial [Acidimicrobiales bacterium]